MSDPRRPGKPPAKSSTKPDPFAALEAEFGHVQPPAPRRPAPPAPPARHDPVLVEAEDPTPPERLARHAPVGVLAERPAPPGPLRVPGRPLSAGELAATRLRREDERTRGSAREPGSATFAAMGTAVLPDGRQPGGENELASIPDAARQVARAGVNTAVRFGKGALRAADALERGGAWATRELLDPHHAQYAEALGQKAPGTYEAPPRGGVTFEQLATKLDAANRRFRERTAPTTRLGATAEPIAELGGGVAPYLGVGALAGGGRLAATLASGGLTGLQALAGAEESTVGAIGEFTGNETAKRIAANPLARTAADVAIDATLGNAGALLRAGRGAVDDVAARVVASRTPGAAPAAGGRATGGRLSRALAEAFDVTGGAVEAGARGAADQVGDQVGALVRSDETARARAAELEVRRAARELALLAEQGTPNRQALVAAQAQLREAQAAAAAAREAQAAARAAEEARTARIPTQAAPRGADRRPLRELLREAQEAQLRARSRAGAPDPSPVAGAREAVLEEPPVQAAATLEASPVAPLEAPAAPAAPAAPGRARFPTARTASGTLRPVARVDDGGLVDEWLNQARTMERDSEAALYRFTPDENLHTTSDGRSVMASTKTARGTSQQAEAARRLELARGVQARIEAELEARGASLNDLLVERGYLAEEAASSPDVLERARAARAQREAAGGNRWADVSDDEWLFSNPMLDPRTLGRAARDPLASTVAGAGGGALADEENPLRGAVAGGLAGFGLSRALRGKPLPVGGSLDDVSRGARGANPYADVPEPPRVFHGTNAAFDRFDATKEADGALGTGIYNTQDPLEASEVYAGGGAPNVRPSRVAFRRPLDREAPIALEEARRVVDAMPDGHARNWMENALAYEAPRRGDRLTGRDLHHWLQQAHAFDGRAVRRVLEAAGYDGIVAGRHSVAFTPEQVRSPWGEWGDAPQFGANPMMDPALLARAAKDPLASTAAGAGAGALADEENPARGAVAGGLAGYGVSRALRGNPLRPGLSIAHTTGEFADDAVRGGRPRLEALHNLSAENLAAADQLGGLPSPSLAVVPEGQAFDGYGELTMLGRRELADPASVPVHDADVYSARAPRPEYPKARPRDVQPIVDRWRQAFADTRDNSYDYGLWDELVNNGNPVKARETMARSTGAQLAFLRERGVDLPRLETGAPLRHPDVSTRPAVREFFERAGVEQHARPDDAYGQELAAAVRQGIEELRADVAARVGAEDAAVVADGFLRDFFDGDRLKYARMDQLLHDVGQQGRRVVDERGMAEAVERAMEGRRPEFEAWLDRTLAPFFRDPHLKVGGKRVPYDLESATRAVTSASEIRAKENGGTFGPGAARAAGARRFETLEQMREAAQASIRPREETKAAIKAAEEGHHAWSERVVASSFTGRNYRGQVDTWEGLDAANRALGRVLRAAKGDLAKVTPAKLRDALTREGFAKIPADVLEEGVERARALATSPTEYFEAKPQRAVRFEDFGGAVIPKTAPARVREALERRGVPFREYDPTVAGDRARVRRELSRELTANGGATLFSNPMFDPRLLMRALGDRVGRGAAISGAGLALQAESEDELLDATGRGMVGLGILHAIGLPRMKALGGAVGGRLVDALKTSPAGVKVLNTISHDILADPAVRAAVEAYQAEAALGRARGAEVSSMAAKLGPRNDRVVSDVIEREAFEPSRVPDERLDLTPDEAAVVAAVAERINQEFTALGHAKVRRGLLAPQTVAKREGKYLPRLYADETAAALEAREAAGGLAGGGPKIRLRGDEAREELDMAARNAKGEIREASYRAAFGLEKGYHDVAAAKLFSTLSQLPGAVHPSFVAAVEDLAQARLDAAKLIDDFKAGNLGPQFQLPGMAGTSAVDGAAIRAEARRIVKDAQAKVDAIRAAWQDGRDGFVRLPDSEGLGVLRGAVVRKDVADYLNGLPELRGAFGSALAFWKRAHTVWNLGTHVGNFVSNLALAHMGGLPLHRIPAALRQARRDVLRYGPATKALAEAGILDRGLPTASDAVPRVGKDARGTLRELAATTRPATRQVLEGAGIRPRGRVHQAAVKVGAAAEHAYAQGDNLFRVALYAHLTKRGMKPAEALEASRRQFVTYDTRSPLLHAAKTYASPFILYPAKAVPMLLGQILEHPVRWMTLAAMWGALDQASRRQVGPIAEGDLPKRQRRSGALGYLMPGTTQLPVTGKGDTRYTIDVARFTPLSALTGSPAPGSLATSLSDELPGVLNPGGPLIDVGARLTNTDPFTGEKLVKPGDGAREKAAALAKSAAALTLPSMLSFHAPRVAGDLADGRGRDAAVDALGFVGMRPTVVRPGGEARRAARRFQEQKAGILADARQDLRLTEDPERRAAIAARLRARLLEAARDYQAEAQAAAASRARVAPRTPRP